MIDLSIIIPVYNVEKYIEECIESVIRITELNTQIICIDDCSTDNSLNLLKGKYGSIKNIEIYENSQNSGLAATRNTGIKHATGTYVMFVDSDDYIYPQKISKIISYMRENCLDIVYFDVDEFYDSSFIGGGKDISNNRKRNCDYMIGTGLNTLNKMLSGNEMYGSVCGGIYRKNYIIDHNIKFVNGILHEDISFTFRAMIRAKKVSVLKETIYCYRQRQQSILHQDNYIKRAEGLMLTFFKMMLDWQEICHLPEAKLIENSVMAYIKSIGFWMNSNILRGAEKNDKMAMLRNFLDVYSIHKDIAKEEIAINEIVTNLLEGCNVALYGAGNNAEMLVPMLQDKGVSLAKIFVTKYDGIKEDVKGIKVEEFSCKRASLFDAIIISVSGNVKYEIKKYIIESGYKGKIITLNL